MSAPAPLCTYRKTDGSTCGSPAVKGTELCFHHSGAKAERGDEEQFAPLPFAFPTDRVAMQFNYFLLLQAFNEQRVSRRSIELMLRMLRAMDNNLGKEGRLPAAAEEDCASSDTRFAQESSGGNAGKIGAGGKAPTSQKRDVGHPHPQVVGDCASGESRSAQEKNSAAASSKPVNAETAEALRVISEVNASAPGYAKVDYTAGVPLGGQRGARMNYQVSNR